MAKKKSWLSKLKRFFIAETHSKPAKEKKRRWLLQRLKINRLASLAAAPPLPSPLRETIQDEAEDEQKKHDFTVAIATAAAAEEADAAAHAAAEVVQITGTPQFVQQCEDENQESPTVILPGSLQFIHQYEREVQELAAIKIQTAFRGYLARKALRALKGLVKLQAIIRGRAVRRQAITTLKCLQSMVSIQSQVCARRSQTFEETCECHDNKQWQELRDKIESNNQRRWDDSILTKEEANALFLSKKEAVIKRERIKEYALGHRKSADQIHNKVNGNLRFWLEHWVDTQLAKREDLEDINSVLSSNPRTKDYGRKQLNYSTICQKQYRLDGLVSPISVSRRSFHQKKQYSNGDDDKMSLPSSPGIVPTYMAATESAKAKSRSMSSPKLRPLSFDSYSECNSPYKNKLSVITSVTTEVTSSGRIGKFDGFHYRSPSLKGIPGPVKSSRTLKDLSFNSECSLLNWDRYSSLR